MSIFDRHPGPYVYRKTGEIFNVSDANGDYVFGFVATDANAVLIMAELNARYRNV